MNPTKLAALALLVMLALPAMAQQQRYIEDTALVPLRSEAIAGSSPVHKGLPSGSAVTLIQGDTGTGWSQVRTREGVDGWIQTRYLKREPGARFQVLNALRLMGQPEDGTVTLTQAIEQLSGQLQSVTSERDKLQAENRRLTDDSWQKWFINGVWATGVGGLLTLLLPRILSRRRRYSEWA